MTLIFNLDLDNLTKVTNYAFDRKNNPFPTFYFRLYQNGYDVDMSKFNRLTLRIRVDSTNSTNTVNFTTVTTLNGEKLVEVKLDDAYLGKSDKLFITPIVTYSNKSINLKEFQLIIYEDSKTEMNMIKFALERFNQMYNLYIKAIKRDQINQPNGVIGLDSDGKMSKDRLPDYIECHVREKIFDTDVHGLKLNDKYMLFYYDKDDEYWWEVNGIHGGFFNFPNKPEKYNLFGGYWDSIETPIDIEAGEFTDTFENILDAGDFTSEILPSIHAGKF